MKLAARQTIFFLTAGIIGGVGELLSQPQLFGFCVSESDAHYICLLDTAVNIGWPLITIGEWLALVGVILLFAGERGFRHFFKFSLFFIPIALVIIFALFPTPIFPGVDIERESIARDFGILYTLITLGIVLADLFRPRRAVSK